MLFTEEEIKKVIDIVDLSTIKIVAQVLGKKFLTKEDLDFLKKKGVDLVKLIPKFPSHYQSFLFGRVSAALGESVSSKMTYAEFQNFLSNMGLFEPKTSEMAFYNVAANKTYAHIKGFSDKIKNDIRSSISAEELNYLTAKESAKVDEVLYKEMLKGTFEKNAVKRIASNLANQMQDWNKDWGRIVETESQDIFNLGRAQIFMNDDPNAKVYFDVYPGACKHCIRLYLTHGIGSRPIVFKLSDLIANGTNYGVKSKDWKPTIHPVHPFCFNNPDTQIFTSDGFKKIKDIEVGDLVLTHKNRFRKVTDIIIHENDDSEEKYNIEYQTYDTFNRPIKRVLKRITGNHPVLVNGDWVEAKNINPGDLLETKVVECINCGREIQIKINSNSESSNCVNFDFCKNCINHKTALKQWENEELRKLLAKKAKRQMKSIYKNMPLEERKNRTEKAREAVKNKYPDYNFLKDAKSKVNSKLGKQDTFLEKKISYFLKRLGVEFYVHYFLKNDGTFKNNVKGYYLDFYIPSLNIAIEADGEKWHRNKKDYDKNRDEDVLRVFGVETFRFSEDMIRNNGRKVFKKIKNIIFNHSGKFHSNYAKVLSIKKALNYKSEKYKYLWNLSVEEDESYLADGVIVHNCRCNIRYLPNGYVWDKEKGEFTPPKDYQRKVERKGKAKITIGEKEYII